MGNYFNELRWKIIRANNLLQFIHQVTIEIRFRKSLAQERFKSNLEFRNQIIILLISVANRVDADQARQNIWTWSESILFGKAKCPGGRAEGGQR